MKHLKLTKMKKTMKTILCELLRDSSKSDRELAKHLGVSQPTVSRLRNRLMDEGLIRHFSVTPDLNALGFEIIAITSFTSDHSDAIAEKARKWTMSRPNVLFAARAEGKGRNAVMVSLHTNYTDYHNFISEIKNDGRDIVADYDTMLVSLGESVIKPFNLKYIADILEKTKE